jgi:S-(hydroxymethyl)glutathione dehydrogenase/alcohol dehydrogenase
MKIRGAAIRRAPGKYGSLTSRSTTRARPRSRSRWSPQTSHSDDHIATGDTPVAIYPMSGGHEGAGVVESVGQRTPNENVSGRD